MNSGAWEVEDVAPPLWVDRLALVVMALLTVAAMPVVVGLVFWLTPFVPGWELIPFALITASAIAIGWRRSRWRVIAGAMVLGEVLTFAAFWWMLSQLAEFD